MEIEEKIKKYQNNLASESVMSAHPIKIIVLTSVINSPSSPSTAL